MFAVLRHYGIRQTLVNAIQALYSNSNSAVMVDGSISEPFDVTIGVLQGDVLAPFLFIVLVDYLLDKASGPDSGVVTCPRQSRRYPTRVLNDLDFAILPSLSLQCLGPSLSSPGPLMLQQILALLSAHLRLNYMTIICQPQPPLQVYGYPINHVTNFRYLGSMMGSSASDLKRRKALTWTAFWKLEHLWKSPTIPISTKVKLFDTTCVTVLLYG